jgi:hypothetical protein
MDDQRASRLAGWAGIVFSVLSLIVLPMALPPPPPPALGATGAQLATWFADHKLGFLVGNYLGILAFVPGLVQLAVLAARVRRLQGPNGWFSSLILATGAFTYAMFACSLALFQVLPFLVDARQHDMAEAMGSLAMVWFALDGLGALPLVLFVGWAGRATGALPKWFAPYSWLTALLATVMSLGALTTQPAWLAAGGPVSGLGFIAFFVWTGVLGGVFLRIKE